MALPFLDRSTVRELADRIPHPMRPDRFRGDGLGVRLADLEEADHDGVRAVYDALNAIYDEWRRSPSKPRWDAIAASVQPFLDPKFAETLNLLGKASATTADDAVKAALHDLRGGGLSALVMEVELLRSVTEDPRRWVSSHQSELDSVVDLARDHAKMMRNAITDLDPVRTKEDATENPHHLEDVVHRWDGRRHLCRGMTAETAARLDHESVLSSCCLEMSAVDRVIYNLLNNATTHAADGRVALDAVHLDADVVRIVVSNRVRPDQAEWLARSTDSNLGRLFLEALTRGGEGVGLQNVVRVVGAAFGIARPELVVTEQYVGAKLVDDIFAAWFHWPTLRADA